MLTPKPVALQELAAGDVGFIVANIKRVADARVGDTIVKQAGPRRRWRASKPSSRWYSPDFFR